MWHSIYLTVVVSSEWCISSVPLSIVFRRGSESTGLPRCICISHKAQRRATVILSYLWQRGASERLCGSKQVGSVYQLGLLYRTVGPFLLQYITAKSIEKGIESNT